jgi:hypothetical protein
MQEVYWKVYRKGFNMLNLKYLILLLAVIFNLCRAESINTADGPGFRAQVTNIDRTNSGKVFVTVTFSGTEDLRTNNMRVELTRTDRRSDASCGKSATLIDSDGAEYFTSRCLSQGLVLYGGSKTTFVFEFNTAQRNSNIEKTYSLMIPLEWWVYQVNSSYVMPGNLGQMTLSFSKLKANN